MPRITLRALRFPTVLVGALALSFAPATAQEDGAAGKSWELASELGASIFFGASDQTSILFKSDYKQSRDYFELALSGAFDYGEAQPEPGLPARVNQRAWGAGFELDYELGNWAPFVYGNGEGSLQRQIDLRLAGGAGVRYRFIDTGRTQLNVSVAVQGERTNPREAPGVSDEVVTLARSNNRVRFQQTFGDERATFSQLVAYRPALGDSDDYTIDSETAFTFTLNSTFSFKASLVNRYDNLAESRGAVSNNDGRVFFAIVATH
jgi:hypothetical protein